MSVKPREYRPGSSWWDVKVYCLEVGKAHNGYVVVTMSPNLPERVSKSFAITVGWYPRARPVADGYLMGVSEYWPHIDFKSMTDLLMKMIYDLDWRLTVAERDKLTQSHF